MVGTEKDKGKQLGTKDNSLYQNFPLWGENDLPKMSGCTAIFFPGKIISLISIQKVDSRMIWWKKFSLSLKVAKQWSRSSHQVNVEFFLPHLPKISFFGCIIIQKLKRGFKGFFFFFSAAAVASELNEMLDWFLPIY